MTIPEIISSSTLLDFEREDMMRRLLMVKRQFYERDQRYQGWSVEESLESIGLTGYGDLKLPLKHIIDLKMLDGPRTILVDWKTRQGEISKEVIQRYRDSWQWRIYLASVPRADKEFRYRIVGDTSSIEVVLQPYKGMVDEVGKLLDSVAAMVEEQQYQAWAADGAHGAWTRSMPGACKAYGRWCPFVGDCRDRVVVTGAPPVEHLSYSSVETALLCMERLRRGRLAREAGLDEESEEAQFGLVFHECVKVMYESTIRGEDR